VLREFYEFCSGCRSNELATSCKSLPNFLTRRFCADKKTFVRLRQKLFSSPVDVSQKQQNQSIRFGFGFCGLDRNLFHYMNSIPFGQIISFHSQSDSKAFYQFLMTKEYKNEYALVVQVLRQES